MKFLLIAPETTCAISRREFNVRSQKPKYRTRQELDQSSTFAQTWSPPENHAAPEDSDRNVTLESLHTVTSGLGRVHVAIARIEFAFSIVEIEGALTDAMEKAVAPSLPKHCSLLWVHRSIIVDTDQNVPAGWLMEGVETKELTVPLPLNERLVVGKDALPDLESATAKLAWGNGIVAEQILTSPTSFKQFVGGLADAQLLWAQLDHLSQRSVEVVYDLNLPTTHKQRASKLANSAQQLATSSLMVELTHEEFLTETEGLRRAAAMNQLDSWNYSTLEMRVTQRLRNLEQVANQAAAQRESVYRRIVELILFFIGLSTLVQVYLGLVDISRAEAANSFPTSNFGILSWFRSADVDIALIVNALILIFVPISISLVRKFRG